MEIAALILAGVVLESVVAWRLRRSWYEWRDSEQTLGLAFGWVVSAILGGALMLWSVGFAWRRRVFDLGEGRWALLYLFVVADLAYYLWHRLNHNWRWLWASHFVHHTAPRLNVLASLRQGWTDLLSGGWLFWSCLGLIGFTPAQLGLYFGLLLVWEGCTHNQWTPRLGPLEWVLVTPSHHRVHHSLDPAHVDRNFGGVLIVWDRLFGTFVSEGSRRVERFGVAGFDPTGATPLAVALHEWRRLAADIRGGRPRGWESA